MADIELVIKIPEESYEYWKEHKYEYVFAEAVANGTQLPKGHGRIIDETKINKCEQIGLIVKDGNITRCFATGAPTIIPADKEE